MKNILQTSCFKRNIKKLHSNQKNTLDQTIQLIFNNPEIGVQKKGDLASVYVYKFKIQNQEFLLAYQIDKDSICLLSFGSHKNFYRDLKK